MSRIIIIGAGPTGLGSAWRLAECKQKDMLLLEAQSRAGGLATSFVDGQGFTWDIGGHVQFSHYEYFDHVMDALLGRDGWIEHERECWVWMRERFIPYPLQNNLHRLPEMERNRCLEDLRTLKQCPRTPSNFQEWILSTFGKGIGDSFMLPYNAKVWAHPAEQMNAAWVGERVATPDLQRLLANTAACRDDVSWGPNHTFRFPRYGGTGAIWNACAARLPAGTFQWGAPVERIDLSRKRLWMKNGDMCTYDFLISTMPLTELVYRSGAEHLFPLAERGLLHSSSNIVGIGLEGKIPDALRTKCWMYYPEENCPFYRVTVFSNYSPYNVPDSTRNWSLMAEISESAYRPVNQETLVRDVIEGVRRVGLLHGNSRIVSTWKYRAAHGYPTPGLHRDDALSKILPYFEKHDVYSRGRFGAWKYEVSNQDHSFMQGVEVVERILHGRAEITVADANYANSGKHSWPFTRWNSGRDEACVTATAVERTP